MPIIQQTLITFSSLFLQPLLYLGVILLVLQYRRQIQLERKLFSTRIHSLAHEVLISISYGFLGGIIASGLMIGLGVVFQPTGIWILWLITGILSLFHIRFLCLSYSTGVLGIVISILKLLPEPSSSYLHPIWKEMMSIHVPSLIAIVAILHLVEGILIRLQAGKQATPLFIETKRGKLVGAITCNLFGWYPYF
ncbi:hypothetical protein [Tepidibacillus marianensis]|uniref:hypothetical protein n=1 Tax=Tepidibacillus marianensis TaxID=3131995 RepID=UPI0030CC4B19